MTDRTVTVHLNLAVTRFLRNGKLSEEQIAKVRREAERLDKVASSLTKGGLAAAFAGVPGLISAVGPPIAAGAGIAVTAAASFTTLAVAVNGVGGALKAVHENDPEKLAEALAKLSTNARAFVNEYERVKPTLDRFGDDAQDELFHQLLGDLEILTRAYIPTMLNQLPKLASGLGKAGHELAMWGAAPETVAKVNRQIDLATDLTDDWARFLKASLGLLLDLADAGEAYTRKTVAGLANGTEAFQRWLATAKAQGELNQLFTNGGRVIAKLGDLAGQTGALLLEMAANPALTDATVALLDILHMTLEVAYGLLNVFGKLPAPLQSAVATFAVTAGAAMLLAGRLAAMKAAAATAMLNLQSIGPAGERAASGLSKVAQHAGRAATALIALQIASVLVAGVQDDLNPQVDALSQSLAEFAKTGKLSGEAARVLGEDMKDLDTGLKFLADTDNDRRQWARRLQDGLESLVPGLAGTNTSLTLTRERVIAVDQALAGMVRAGNAKEAQAFFERLAVAQAAHGVSLEELRAKFPQYIAATQVATTSTQALAGAHRSAAMNAAILNEGLAGAVKFAGSLRLAFDQLRGGAMAFADAELNAEEAIDRLTESLKENGKSMDVTTDAGQANKRALLEVTNTAIDAAQAKYNETVATKGEAAALKEANAVYHEYIDQLRKAMLAAGMKKEEVEKLLSVYANMPPIIATSITTPGLDAAIAKTLKLIELRRLLGSNVAAANAYNNSGYTSGKRWGGITEHARDGLLREAEMFSAVSSGARYAFAEPATGGEAFVPRNGNYQRSMSILERAAGWYGAAVVPGGRGESKPAKQSGMSPAEFGRVVKAALHGVAVVMDGRTVGRIQAGQADLYARGG